MAKREGDLLTSDQYEILMQSAVGAFRRARDESVFGQHIVGLLVLGSMGAGIRDKKKPPRTDSDLDSKNIMNQNLDEAQRERCSFEFWQSFAGLMSGIVEVGRYFPSIPDDEQHLHWHLTEPIRWHHDAVSLICGPDRSLIDRLSLATTRNRLGLYVYSAY